MENNYTVYQHVTPDGMYYFGQTNNIKRRWRGNGRYYKTTSLQPYIEKYGWENIQHKVLFENLSKEDALSIEDSLILSGREKGNCINKRRSGNVSKEEGYNKKQSKQYYETNKGQVQEKQKQYYETNKGQILEQQKQYYQKNRDRILEKRHIRYQRKKLEKQLKEVETTPLF